jgi:MFS family permease
VATIILVPWLADNYGKRWNTIINYFVFLAALMVIILSHSLTVLYIALFIAGTTFGARVIVALNYLVEFFSNEMKQVAVFVKMILGPSKLILLTFIFQFLTKSWILLAVIFWVMYFLASLYISITVPESPVFYFGFKNFSSTRDSLTQVANFNRVYQISGLPYQNFRFPEELDLSNQ